MQYLQEYITGINYIIAFSLYFNVITGLAFYHFFHSKLVCATYSDQHTFDHTAGPTTTKTSNDEHETSKDDEAYSNGVSIGQDFINQA